MIVLYIVLGILVFIILLLCIPVEVEAKYNEQLSLTIRYLFIPFSVFPKKEKQEKPKGKFAQFCDTHFTRLRSSVRRNSIKARRWVKGNIKKTRLWLRKKLKLKQEQTEEQKKAKPAEKEKSSFAQLREARGFSGMIALLWRIFTLLNGMVGRLLKGVTVQRFDFTAIISGDDAADTAISYGKWCSVLYPLLAAILGSTRRYNKNINISPDFSGGRTSVDANALLRFFPMMIVAHAVGTLLKLLFLEIKDAIKDKMAEATQSALQNIDQGGAI